MCNGWRFLWTALAACCAALGAGSAIAQNAPPRAASPGSAAPNPFAERPPTSFLEDAGLRDICFVNAELGWAVGDRGVIWHTSTGGRAWRMQASPVACRLDSVSFLDEFNGWAAGGFVHPYTHQSTGVLLRTRDGGKSWQALDGLALPAITRIRMFDDRRGLVAGYGSALFPAGLLATQDGGRTWIPLRGPVTSGWLAADFRDMHHGVIAGNDGRSSLVRGSELLPPSIGDFGPRRLRDVALVGPGGWLVGDGGLILATADGGSSWTSPPQAPPVELARQCDFHAVAAHGTHVWVAGTPGSTLFHSPDGGRSWEPQATGQSLPLAALHFADNQRGWAAGALGTILATTDGGKSWRKQRGGGTRAALLGLFGSLETVPLELIASQAAGEGYLTAVEVVGHPPRESQPASARVADAERRGQDALVSLGGAHLSAGLRFPLDEPALRLSPAAIVRRWDSALWTNNKHAIDMQPGAISAALLQRGGYSRELIEEQLVRSIRMWRPEVVVAHAPSGGDDGLAPLVAQLVLSAVERAGDPKAYPQQQSLGLAAWQVRKVFGTLAAGQAGPVTLTQGQFVPRVGRSLGELAASADGIVAPALRPRPANVAFQSLVDRLPQGVGRNDFFSGINLPAGGEARRTLDLSSGANLDEVRRMAARRRNMQQLVERAAQAPHGGAAWLAQTSDLTRDMHDQAAGELLFHLGGQYQASGRFDLAAEAYDLLLGKYPQHPLAEPATWWLLRYYASGEVAWREQHARREPSVVPAAQRDPAAGASPMARPEQVVAGPEGVVFAPILAQPSGHIAAATLPVDPSPAAPQTSPEIGSPSNRRERALAMARLLERTRPPLYAESAVKFPVAAATRSLGLGREAEKMFGALVSAGQRDAWWNTAQGERWIADPRGISPKPVATCVRSPQRPRLDGQLNDATWKFDKALELRGSPEEAGSAMVLLACDNDFLYLAATCPKAAGCGYQPAAGTRSYDADLGREDRIELLLDIDRDYASFYRLTIDHRGWTGESCFGDRSWNPQWFVAASQTAESWTIEAAIPLAELAAAPPSAKQPWALGVQRILPGVGFQSWTRPASCDGRPEGFGLLIAD